MTPLSIALLLLVALIAFVLRNVIILFVLDVVFLFCFDQIAFVFVVSLGTWLEVLVAFLLVVIDVFWRVFCELCISVCREVVLAFGLQELCIRARCFLASSCTFCWQQFLLTAHL